MVTNQLIPQSEMYLAGPHSFIIDPMAPKHFSCGQTIDYSQPNSSARRNLLNPPMVLSHERLMMKNKRSRTYSKRRDAYSENPLIPEDKYLRIKRRVKRLASERNVERQKVNLVAQDN